MAVAAVGLCLLVYGALGAFGAWMIATGRQVRTGIPPVRQDPVIIRLLGALWVVVALAMSVFIVKNGVPWDAVISTYFFAGLAVWSMINRAQKARSG
jgi:hypothetical protein